jgi:hypothetical protein
LWGEIKENLLNLAKITENHLSKAMSVTPEKVGMTIPDIPK